MTDVLVYNNAGENIDCLVIDDNLKHVNGRVCKGEKYYYKGAGSPYRGHFIDPDPILKWNGFDYTITSDVFYLGPCVKKVAFTDKTGIFQEKYQPQFSDFIGSCGVKELSIIENSLEFEKSSAEIIKSINWDKENGQYYFIIDYKCGRKKYIQDPNPKYLYELLEYMTKSNWNFVWDKTSIEDITYNGLVSDVGDLFFSKSLSSKLGSIYSAIYSLGEQHPSMYMDFIRYANLQHTDSMSYAFNAALLLQRFGVDIRELKVSNLDSENFKHIVLNYLVQGKNCGDCCFIELGDQIRDKYLKQTKQQLGLD
jgi:hypothetical protein